MSDRSAHVLVLSGAISSGKSTLANMLEEHHDAKVLRTQELILIERPLTDRTRKALQTAGDELDNEYDGKWIGRALSSVMRSVPATMRHSTLFVVDAVRTIRQVKSIRESIADPVIHIHITAPYIELENRFNSRSTTIDTGLSYREARSEKTERAIVRLRGVADYTLNSGECSAEEMLASTMRILNRAN